MGKIQVPGSAGRQDSSPFTSGIVVPLRPHVECLLEAAISKNTASTYQKGINSFETFCTKHNFIFCWPPPLDHIINYIAYLHANKVSYSTTRCYLSGISYKLQLEGQIDNTKTFIVKKMLEGFHRLNPAKDVRSPISLSCLNKLVSILPTVCTSLYEAVMFSAAFHLAFFALLRISEFTFTSNNAPALLFHDVTINETHIGLYIKGSKTDQYNRGTKLQIEINSQTQSLFKHVREFLAVRPQIQGLFFCHFNHKPLTKYQFTSVLHKSVKFIGLDTTTFKSHSFRIGGATHLYFNTRAFGGEH